MRDALARYLRSSLWLLLLVALAVVPRVAHAQAGPTRNFQMVVWDVPDSNVGIGLDADLGFFTEGGTQPSGNSIFKIYPDSWYLSGDQITTTWTGYFAQYDFSRIEAVLVDEPYWNVTGHTNTSNPCSLIAPDSTRVTEIQNAHSDLANLASLLRSHAPSTRLWVNFSVPEVQWMTDRGICPMLNDSFIDVVSVDDYGVDFAGSVQAYYDQLVANKAYSGQQLALVPGTFTLTNNSTYDGTSVADRLQGYFDYANSLNQACNLPPSASGFTGNSDGCPVWIVGGWLFDTFTDTGGVTYFGEGDPNSQAVAQAWRAEMALPASQNVHSGDALTITVTDIF